MTDYSRDRLGPGDEERLPWLEPVEEYDDPSGISPMRIAIIALIVLAVIGAVAGSVFWLRGQGDVAATGDGSLIKAPDAYYKQRPDKPGGMDVGSDDEIVYSASQGNEAASNIDLSAPTETPVNIDRATTVSAPLPPPAAKPALKVADAAVSAKATPPAAKPVAPKPILAKPAPVAATPAVAASGGGTIQLGAFSSQAKANAAWKSLSGRFGFLGGLTQQVAPVQSGDKTLYRLRASGADAGGVCARLKTAGESCSVVG